MRALAATALHMSPLVITEDYDLDSAVDITQNACFGNTGVKYIPLSLKLCLNRLTLDLKLKLFSLSNVLTINSLFS